MKANLSFLGESMDKAKIELEAENKNEELILSRLKKKHDISVIDFRLIQASVKMTMAAGEDFPMKMEIIL